MNSQIYRTIYKKIHNKETHLMLVFTDMDYAPRYFDVDNCIFVDEAVGITNDGVKTRPIIGLFF